MAERVKTKRPCCHSQPRCKRCPVVLARLDKAGKVQRVSKRTYVFLTMAKRDMKTARAR
jgi:hypothetical protein